MFVKKLIVRLALIILIVGIFSAAAVLAAPGINKQLSYQGTLKSGGINVADGDFDIIFRIYDAATDGNLLWTGTHTTANGNPVTLTNGVFNAFLGSGTGNAFTLDFNTDTLYLGITVSTDSEMTPRQRFVASVYAFNADTVDGIGFATTTISTGDILYASASNLLQRLAPGDDGQVLKLNSGLPSWSTDLQGSGGGSGLFATTTDSLVVYLVDTNDVLVIGGNATTTTGNILEIVGNALFGGNGIFTNTLTAYNTITAPIFTATSTTATSTLPYLAVSNNSSLGTVIDGTWQGSTVGVAYGGTGSTTPTNFLFGDGLGNLISTSTIAQNYIDAALARTSNVLTLSNWFATTTHANISSLPSLSIIESQISDLQSYLILANWFATTSAPQLATLANLTTVGTIGTGVWQGTALTDTYIDNDLTISGGTINNTPIGATTPSTGVFTSATTTNFGLNSETFTDLTGTGLQNSSGVLTLNATGDWTGTFDGQEGTYYLDAPNLTNFGVPFYTFFNATTTDALSEGSTNLYYTDSRADARINATTSIGTLTALPNLATVGTIGTGVWQGTTIGEIFGGTGESTYVIGDILYADGANSLARLATSTAGSVLQLSFSTGLPSYVATSTLNVALSDTTGTLAVNRGGTGLTTFGGTNTILYTSGADTLTSNANFVFDGTNFGVGTTSPLALLSASSTNAVTALFDQRGTSDIFQLQDSGSTVFVVQDGGNVGIGTSTPDNALTLVGSIANDVFDFSITSNDALIKLGENQQGPHGIYFGDDGGVAAQIMYHTGSNLLSFEVGTTTAANLDTTDYLTIDFDTGNVGIGNSDLRSAFEIVSSNNVLADLAVEENYHLKIRNPNNTTGEGIGISFGMSSTNSQQTAAIVAKRTGSNGQGTLQFYTKQSTSSGVPPVLALTIDQNGNVVFPSGTNIGVHTTSDPTAFIHLLGDHATQPSIFFDFSTNGFRDIAYRGRLQIGTWDGTTWTERAQFDSSGQLGIGATPDELLHIAKAVDGVAVGLLIENSQANTNASINETAEIRFGFGGDNDVARIVAGKIDDYDGPASE
ncbi:hypothetical protein IIA95_02215, partial [Patescibacteria group bacterium]|nr:hypothetical protein [Patescibacteria group bacterium]